MITKKPQQPGVAVDAQGGAVIDPTKNVESLVEALRSALAEFRTSDIKYVDTQLEAAEKLQSYARSAESRYNEFVFSAESKLRDQLRMADEKLADAETRRIDQLALTSERFETTIRNMLAESVRTTSDLVSNQLVQIQATFNERVSKLEAGAFTQAGKSSVQDPQTADALSRMAGAISSLSTTTTDSMNKTSNMTAEAIAKLTVTLSTMRENESGVGGQRKGMADTNARLLAVVMAVAAVASPVIAILVTIMAMRGR
jgi:DNA anti-recombination protein RmuC